MLAVFKNLGKVNCLGINVRWGTVCTPTAMVIPVKPSDLSCAESEGLLFIMPHRRDSAIFVMLAHPYRCHRLASVLSTAPWYSLSIVM